MQTTHTHFNKKVTVMGRPRKVKTVLEVAQMIYDSIMRLKRVPNSPALLRFGYNQLLEWGNVTCDPEFLERVQHAINLIYPALSDKPEVLISRLGSTVYVIVSPEAIIDILSKPTGTQPLAGSHNKRQAAAAAKIKEEEDDEEWDDWDEDEDEDDEDEDDVEDDEDEDDVEDDEDEDEDEEDDE